MFKHQATSRLIHKSQYFISSYFFFCFVALFYFRLFSVCLLLDFVSHQIFYSVCLNHVFFGFFIYFGLLFWYFKLCITNYKSLNKSFRIFFISSFSFKFFIFTHKTSQSSICFMFQHTKPILNSIIILFVVWVYLFIYLVNFNNFTIQHSIILLLWL